MTSYSCFKSSYFGQNSELLLRLDQNPLKQIQALVLQEDVVTSLLWFSSQVHLNETKLKGYQGRWWWVAPGYYSYRHRILFFGLWFFYWTACTTWKLFQEAQDKCVSNPQYTDAMTTEVFGNWILMEVSHLLVASIKVKNINFKSNFQIHCVNNIASPTINKPTTPVRVFKHFGEYRKEFALAKANEAMMEPKAFRYSSKKKISISSLSENWASGFQSHVTTAVAAFPEMTEHVNSYLQQKTHQMDLFDIMIWITGTLLVSHSMIFMT